MESLVGVRCNWRIRVHITSKRTHLYDPGFHNMAWTIVPPRGQRKRGRGGPIKTPSGVNLNALVKFSQRFNLICSGSY